MIQEVLIANTASYCPQGSSLQDLSKINFVYGANGTGKTTISRVLADPAAQSPQCSLKWLGPQCDVLVFNQDFVKANFTPALQSGGKLKGIFTLGSNDASLQQKIQDCKTEIRKLDERLSAADDKLADFQSPSGDSAVLDENFKKRCWEVRKKFEAKFEEAFPRTKKDRGKFKNLVLEKAKNVNSDGLLSLKELEYKAETVFSSGLSQLSRLNSPTGDNLLTHEKEPILSKKIVGAADVDIGQLIERLGNSDWVKQGLGFFQESPDICPFCQQQTPQSLQKDLESFFDDVYEKDVEQLKLLCQRYKTDGEGFLEALGRQPEIPEKYLDRERFQALLHALTAEFNSNIGLLREKLEQPSRPIELNSLAETLSSISSVLHETNQKIDQHNETVRNLSREKDILTREFWDFVVADELGGDLQRYRESKERLEKKLQGLNKSKQETRTRAAQKRQELQTHEQKATNDKPTITSINGHLTKFGFSSFKLEAAEQPGFYKLVRPDGGDVKETLSEGEKNFVAFLYFYHLLEGDFSRSSTGNDKVVVFDDPISSLDSDVLFVVSSLVKDVFQRIRDGSSRLKQAFVLTHNVYFHKEVSFNTRRLVDKKLKDETFWTVRRQSDVSLLTRHEANPIRTSYELLWQELKSQKDGPRNNLTIQNTMRRILENYFKILGGLDKDEICDKFTGESKLICNSLYSWINDGSHIAGDSLFVHADDSLIDRYLKVFREIFVKLGHEAHYKMMMGEEQ